VSAAIHGSATARWGAPAAAGELPVQVRERAGELLSHFSDAAWTWRR
jgi:hypothetical protein